MSVHKVGVQKNSDVNINLSKMLKGMVTRIPKPVKKFTPEEIKELEKKMGLTPR